jgi:hypothetical protein
MLTLAHSGYDAARDLDLPPDEHILIRMCRLAGVRGPVELRPYIFLTPAELAAGRLAENQVAVQSTGLASPLAMLNREWYPQRFQELCAQLRSDVRVVQVGSASDLKLEGAIDLRGKTSLRQTAAVLANSLVFIGLVGFVMHLARAVDCRSVIIYGGREKPALTGYVANKNLYHQVRCAPCWLRNPCDFQPQVHGHDHGGAGHRRRRRPDQPLRHAAGGADRHALTHRPPDLPPPLSATAPAFSKPRTKYGLEAAGHP